MAGAIRLRPFFLLFFMSHFVCRSADQEEYPVNMEKIKGYVEHFIYRNNENGYSVMNIVCDGEDITCVGTFQNIDVGTTIEVEGEMIQHAMYGEQLKAQSYRITVPEDETSMERYLGSGAVKGVGEALAARIVRKFGADTFRIIEEEPERLSEIRGISEHKALDIAQQMNEKREMRDVMIFLQKYGISNAMSVRIFNEYGTEIYRILQENPYRLAEDIGGIGFRTADEIAGKIGIRVDSDYRIRSGLLYTLQQAAMEGNSYLPKKLLIQDTCSLLGVEPEMVENQISFLAMDSKLICKNGTDVYAASFYNEERACAAMLYDLNICDEETASAGAEENQKQRILDMEQKKNMVLDELQRRAVIESIRNGVVIITGGPGTGKTTTINTIIQYYADEGLDIMLAAPTGRAAKRMTEATGYEARTIHRMLEVNGQMEDKETAGSVRFNRNAENPLAADAIIIDEMSMVDMHLFYALLKAVVPGMHLILVGDASQLPSVGPGQVLHDLIDSGKFPTIVLQKIFRQAEESDIVMNAHRIHRGEMLPLDNRSKDFFFLERNDVNVIYKHMVQLIRDKLPRYVDAQPTDIQVLTPMRKGALGAETLNDILQEYLNPPQDGKKEYAYGDHILRAGDKVMQIRNNYQAEWEVTGKYNIPVDQGTGIFNGDMGIIQEINTYSQELTVEFDEHRKVRYPFAQLDEIELAYAITIHKSQGSEYPAVVMPILGGPRMLLNRNLLYTAVTRARNCVLILGSRETIQTMIDNEEQLKRYTGLSERIKEAFEVMEQKSAHE